LSAPLPQVVVLSSIDWNTTWQRHMLFAAQFAEAGHEVFFVENTGFRDPRLADLDRVWARLARIVAPPAQDATNTIPAGLKVISPQALPPTNGLFRRLNASIFVPRIMRKLHAAGLRENPIVIVYFATATTLALIDALRPSKLVYDYASNFRGHPDAPRDYMAQEAELLKRTDLVVCDSNFLYEQKKAEHRNVVQLHQGVDEKFLSAKPPAPDYRKFVYYGTWVPDLNPDYLQALADAGFDVSLSGFVKGPLPPFPHLPPVPKEKLLERLEGFDVFLLPHRINSFTVGVIPAKIYECLAMGRPVIAAPLPSLAPYKDLLYIAETPEDWVRVARGLPKTETPELRAKRIALASEHTHRAQFQRLRASIDAIRRPS
ncbi:MAG TPA: hypothetical protein VN915_03965, partial [Elusimicrobiota bacterium]|nr:hypothetical protein [Elusimicrobiota bacterium]